MRAFFLFIFLNALLFGENIERFIVDLYINSSGKVAVKEEILYNFGNTPHHGIIRDITKNDTIIKNVSVLQNSKPANVYLKNSKKYYRIKIGDKNSYVTGLVDYKISYNIDGYIVRNLDGLNYIIIDAIGTGWSVWIKYAKITIHLPKKLIENAGVKVYNGEFGSTATIPYTFSDNTIKIIKKDIPPHKAITISLSFDPSLIKVSKKPTFDYYKKLTYWLFLIPIIGIFYFFIDKYKIFSSFGSIMPVYYPIKDLNLLEVGLLKDNFVDFKELKPAILELANLNYIKFKTIDGDLYLQKQEKDISNLSAAQQKLLNAIFGSVKLVNSKLLKIKKEDFEDIKASVHNSLLNKRYFKSSLINARYSFLIIAGVVVLISFLGLMLYIFRDGGLESIFPVAVVSVFITVGVFMFLENLKQKDISGMLFAVAWIAFSSFFLYSVVFSKGIFISILLMIVVSVMGTIFIYLNINTLTFKGLKAKRDIFGLKEFIKRANKDKIAYLLQQNPHFLDALLPYAVMFGLNKHWIKLYYELNTQLPTWYEGDWDSFGGLDFDLGEESNSNSSDFGPYISSDDFDSFGGFSGGGIGGGGGSSW